VKILLPSFFFAACLFVLAGCSGKTGGGENNAEEYEIIFTQIAETAKKYLLGELPPHVIETINEIDAPEIETAGENDVEDAEGHGENFWLVKYITTRDRFLGPIFVYVHKDTLEVCCMAERPHQ